MCKNIKIVIYDFRLNWSIQMMVLIKIPLIKADLPLKCEILTLHILLP